MRVGHNSMKRGVGQFHTTHRTVVMVSAHDQRQEGRIGPGDAAGETIADDMVKSFKRDFGIQNIEAFKVALTIDQVEEFDLEPSMEAKETSPTYGAFVEKYGITDAYELEALDPADLADVLRDAINDVLDIEAYNRELAAEEQDSTKIIAVQQQAMEFFKSLKL